MLTCKLGNEALNVLRRNLVERSLVRPLQHSPERIESVGMGHAVDVFGDLVLDAFVRVRDAFISWRAVSVDDRIRFGMFRNETLHCLGVGAFNHPCADLIAFAALRTNHGGLIYRSPSLRLPCVLALDLFLRLPPMYVSPNLTGPSNGISASPAHASRIRCIMNQALRWLIPKSRCSFMLETDFRLVRQR